MKLKNAILSSFLTVILLALQPVAADALEKPAEQELKTPIPAHNMSFARKITSDDLIFGMAQTDKMIQDRKPMAFLVQKGDPIYTWVSRQFAGEACGERVSWNPDENLGKPPNYKSDHCYPSKNERPYIRIRSGKDKDEVYDEHLLWECCIFQLFSLRNFESYDQNYNDACNGKFTKDEWVRKNSENEFNTNKTVKDFFYKSWAPFLKSKGIDYREHTWEVEWTPSTFDEWMAAYSDPDGYPWDFWGTYFDTKIIPYLKAKKEYSEKLRSKSPPIADPEGNKPDDGSLLIPAEKLEKI